MMEQSPPPSRSSPTARDASPTVSRTASKSIASSSDARTFSKRSARWSTMRSAPSRRHASALTPAEAVVATNAAPNIDLASCIATDPTPPAPPSTRTRAPESAQRPHDLNALTAVMPTSGTAAAAMCGTAGGLRAHTDACTQTSSAHVPQPACGRPAIMPNTASPTCRSSTPSPTLSMTPEKSKPTTRGQEKESRTACSPAALL
mmetsp:Transcript_33363/g.110332  ORF Transcript_33363/g.110332 Transcript_33363/m.110332 type:complete len:204 (-) Transcript_33363:157-768(-)